MPTDSPENAKKQSCVYHTPHSDLKCSVAPSTPCIECSSWDEKPDGQGLILPPPTEIVSKKNVVYFVGQDDPIHFRLPLINYAIDYQNGLISLVLSGRNYRDAKEYVSRWTEPREVGLFCHHYFGEGYALKEMHRYLPMGKCLLNEFLDASNGVTFLERRIGLTPFLSVHWQAPRKPSFEKYMRLFLMAGMVSEWEDNRDFQCTGKASALTERGLLDAYAAEGLSAFRALQEAING